MVVRAPQDRVVAALAADGWAVEPDYLDGDSVRQLRERQQRLARLGLLVAAGVGRGDAHAARSEVRGDRIRWLGDAPEDGSEVALFGLVESLRLAANRELMLGLIEFEGHYATYPVGARYAPHRDRFRDDDSRVLSLVLYLNASWRDSDGGHLRIHLGDGAVREVTPAGGTLVAFLSDQFEHEVLPATRERMAIAGWFRRRG
jgi:SM-20-related protein